MDLTRSSAALFAVAVLAACGDDDPTAPPASTCTTAAVCAAEIGADITTSRTLHRDTVYTLTDFVHVTGNGTKLTIQPGTRILGRPGSALFVLPGAQIEAVGTADAPIVFTSAEAEGNRRPGDWGGLILVGRGVINRGGQVQLEGTGSGGNNGVVTYSGGTDNDDSSGRLSYVRVEFAGFGVATNQELNSFTFAAVGRGTQLDHLQSLAGLDDSFEWFGGAVDGKYLVSYESGDDHFDAAEGYVGRNQFLIAYQTRRLVPRPGSGVASNDPQGFEIDGCDTGATGCTNAFDSQPLTTPVFANFTMIGTGPNQEIQNGSGGAGMLVRRGAGGWYVNGVIARWPRAAISLRDAATEQRFTDRDAGIRNVYVAEIGATAGASGPLFEGGSGRFAVNEATSAITTAAGTVTAASLFGALPAVGTIPTSAAAFDWTPAATSPIATGGLTTFTGDLGTLAGGVVTGTAYVGAASATGSKWWQGWTRYEFPAGQQ